MDYEKTFYTKNKYGVTLDVVTINALDKTIKVTPYGTASGKKLTKKQLGDMILFLQIAGFKVLSYEKGV